MRITVDEQRCIGAGQCAWVAPRLFTQRGSDGVVVLLRAQPDAADEPFAREAVELCPARAIRIDETAARDVGTNPRESR